MDIRPFAPALPLTATQRVAILCHPGCMGMEVMGLADLLSIANRVAAHLAPQAPAPFSVELFSVNGGMVAMAGGWGIATRRPPRRIDWLLVPGVDLTRQAQPKEGELSAEMALLRRHHQRGTGIASVCLGSFLLASAGILDGRNATTSWMFRERFRQQFPAVALWADEALVVDVSASGSPVLTTGSVSAAHDLALYLIARHAGGAVAQATARLTLLDGGRRRQAPYVDADWLLSAKREPARFSENVTAWMGSRLASVFSLPALAEAFHVSPRTLLRRFKAETGTSPLACLQQIRIEAAKKLLSTTADSVEGVAATVGYQDGASFIRLFKRLTGMTPAAFRSRFSVSRGAGP